MKNLLIKYIFLFISLLAKIKNLYTVFGKLKERHDFKIKKLELILYL